MGNGAFGNVGVGGELIVEVDPLSLKTSNNLSDVPSKPTALNNLLPAQSGNKDKALTTDGTSASWKKFLTQESALFYASSF